MSGYILRACSGLRLSCWSSALSRSSWDSTAQVIRSMCASASGTSRNWRRGCVTSSALTALLPSAISVFVTIPVLFLVFVRTLKLLPAGGWGGIFDVHIILPAVTLALAGTAGVTRMMRASSLEVVGQDYVRTARAKGLPERLVIGRHILRNALIPMTTVIMLSLGSLVEGAFIVEGFYGVPGIGALALDSISSRDYPVLMAISLIVALSFVIANLAADVVYSVVDPRIRYR